MKFYLDRGNFLGQIPLVPSICQLINIFIRIDIRPTGGGERQVFDRPPWGRKFERYEEPFVPEMNNSTNKTVRSESWIEEIFA